jgi:hypothetical protein
MARSGKQSFGGQSLHRLGDTPNPYEQAISIIGKTLAPFDEDNLIPCFGFGDGEQSLANSVRPHEDESKAHSWPPPSPSSCCSNHPRLQRVQLPPRQLPVPWLRGGPGLLQEDRAAPQAIR